jgi:hypothetical protein
MGHSSKKKKKRGGGGGGGRRTPSKDLDSFSAENAELIADELTALYVYALLQVTLFF